MCPSQAARLRGKREREREWLEGGGQQRKRAGKEGGGWSHTHAERMKGRPTEADRPAASPLTDARDPVRRNTPRLAPRSTPQRSLATSGGGGGGGLEGEKPTAAALSSLSLSLTLSPLRRLSPFVRHTEKVPRP